MRIILTTILFTVTFAASWAQSADDNPMGYGRDKDGEMGGLLKQQSQSLWNMDIDPNKYRFNIPIPETPRQSKPTPQYGPVITNDGAPGYNTGGSYAQNEKRRNQKKGEFISSTVARSAANMQLWRDHLNQIAEERRARIEAENRADRERGRAEYYQRMGSFHAYNAARDRWMATEGIRRLNSVHAKDMASIPTAKREDKLNVMSGSDMANLLKDDKPKQVKFTVEVVDHFENNNTGNSAPDQSGDNSSNENDQKLWDITASSSKAFINMPSKPKATAGYEKTLLFKKSELNLEGLFLTTLPGMGCIALIGDSLVLLDNSELAVLEWGKHLDISEVVVCGERTFAKQREKIIEIKRDDTEEVATFETENFSIYPETGKSFIVCAYSNDKNTVTRIDTEGMKRDEVICTSMPIDRICANGKVLFVLIGNKIVDLEPSPALFFKGNDKINDLCMCRDGLLIATDKAVVLLKTKDDITSFSKNGAKRLWSDGEDIYLLDNKGDLYRYSKKQ